MRLVIRIDRELGGYSIFKSLKELGECLQEQDAQTSNFNTEEDYYEENGRISLLSELLIQKKLKKKPIYIVIFILIHTLN